MLENRHLSRAGAFVSFLAVGIPYWQIPYQRIQLPDALLTPGLAVTGFVALLLCLFRVTSMPRAVALNCLAVAAAVMVRVVFDVLRDHSLHNLWPFELGIAALVACAVALGGALVGTLVARLMRGPRHGDAG